MNLHPNIERIGQEAQAVAVAADVTVREALAAERKTVAMDLRTVRDEV